MNNLDSYTSCFLSSSIFWVSNYFEGIKKLGSNDVLLSFKVETNMFALVKMQGNVFKYTNCNPNLSKLETAGAPSVLNSFMLPFQKNLFK